MSNNQSKIPKSVRNLGNVLYPARPKYLLRKASDIGRKELKVPRGLGLPLVSNKAYIRWLKNESMLKGANQASDKYSGKSELWRHAYAKPRPRKAIAKSSVWYTAYPLSIVTEPKQSILQTLGSEELWKMFESIGITGIHTGPVKLAGGIKGWRYTDSVDGHFDRISNKIDPLFGRVDDFKNMSQTAFDYGGIVIDDIIPGHTGKGTDFQLAQMNYKAYPGIYHMVEIDKKDWGILPPVPKDADSINLSPAAEDKLQRKGYIIGKLQRVYFYEKGVKESNWSVTKVVKGVDGQKRRWVYLHYFKEGQPSINWLDPSFAGMKMVIGDAIHSIGDLGSTGLRLDANGFLGLEKNDDDTPGWSEGHPLSDAANHIIASMVRKLGGFTFQELGLSVDDIKAMSENGADLSYDFINRPAYHHALATGNTEFLRLMMNIGLDLGVDPASLVHALDNHDELTYELAHFATRHQNDEFTYDSNTYTGDELRKIIQADLRENLVDNSPELNKPFTENGVSCTTVSLITAALGFQSINDLEDDDIEKVKQVHLLLAAYNAYQPGVFALSGWDLCGCSTLDEDSIRELTSRGDTRWIARGGYDLLGVNPDANSSAAGMPIANNLYGSLSDQLKSQNSFASRLKALLQIREEFEIAVAKQLEVPDVSNHGLLLMIHELSDGRIQMSALNFSNQEIVEITNADSTPANATIYEMFEGQNIGKTNSHGEFEVKLLPYSAKSFVFNKH